MATLHHDKGQCKHFTQSNMLETRVREHTEWLLSMESSPALLCSYGPTTEQEPVDSEIGGRGCHRSNHEAFLWDHLVAGVRGSAPAMHLVHP